MSVVTEKSNAAGNPYSESTLMLKLEAWFNARKMEKKAPFSLGSQDKAMLVYASLPSDAAIVCDGDKRSIHGVAMKGHDTGEEYALAVLSAIDAGAPKLKKSQTSIAAPEAYKAAQEEYASLKANADLSP